MVDQVNGPMVSEVSICNQALGWLGQPRISSLNEESTNAMLCRDNFETCRDSVLEERNWTFATARIHSEVADMDEWERRYMHPIPSNWLHVHRVYRRVDTERKQWSQGWSREGQFVLAKEPVVYIQGTVRETDSGRWTPLFQQALAARIAATLAVPVTQNRLLQGDLWNMYDTFLSQAAVRDGQQGANETFDEGRLVGVRAAGVVDARGSTI